jgi:hypothetical protein
MIGLLCLFLAFVVTPMKTLFRVASIFFLTINLPSPGALAQESTPGSVAVLFQNVRIFDGKRATLSAPSNVLIRGNTIERVSTTPIPVNRRADTTIIESGGRTLMPGLIDAHVHMTVSTPVPSENIIRKSLCFYSSFKFPVLACKFPVPSQKFPVLLSREFRRKPLNLLACQRSKSHQTGDFDVIPC